MNAMLGFFTGPYAKYLIGAAALAIVIGGAYHWGVSAERGRQAELTLKTERKQAKINEQHRAEVAALTAQSQGLANSVESEAHAHATEIERLADENRRLIARSAGRLRDPNATTATCPGMPKAGDPASAVDPAAAGELSEKLSGLLLAEARRADQAAAYANTCHQWVRGLNRSNTL